MSIIYNFIIIHLHFLQELFCLGVIQMDVFSHSFTHTQMHLTDYGVDKYDIGTGFGHFAIATEDVSLSPF